MINVDVQFEKEFKKGKLCKIIPDVFITKW